MDFSGLCVQKQEELGLACKWFCVVHDGVVVERLLVVGALISGFVSLIEEVLGMASEKRVIYGILSDG